MMTVVITVPKHSWRTMPQYEQRWYTNSTCIGRYATRILLSGLFTVLQDDQLRLVDSHQSPEVERQVSMLTGRKVLYAQYPWACSGPCYLHIRVYGIILELCTTTGTLSSSQFQPGTSRNCGKSLTDLVRAFLEVLLQVLLQVHYSSVLHS